MGAAADRRPGARFRAIAHRFPVAAADQAARRRGRAMGRQPGARGSRSSASCSPARAPRARSARRCWRRSPTRRGSCSPARPLRLAFLMPEPEFPEAWDWAFDGEAEALARARLCSRSDRRGPKRGDLSGYDLIVPLARLGLFRSLRRVAGAARALRARASAGGQSARAAALEQRQGLSRRARRQGRPDRADDRRRRIATRTRWPTRGGVRDRPIWSSSRRSRQPPPAPTGSAPATRCPTTIAGAARSSSR